MFAEVRRTRRPLKSKNSRPPAKRSDGGDGINDAPAWRRRCRPRHRTARRGHRKRRRHPPSGSLQASPCHPAQPHYPAHDRRESLLAFGYNVVLVRSQPACSIPSSPCRPSCVSFIHPGRLAMPSAASRSSATACGFTGRSCNRTEGRVPTHKCAKRPPPTPACFHQRSLAVRHFRKQWTTTETQI